MAGHHFKEDRSVEYSRQTERWGVQEIVLQGPAEGNPFTGQWVRGTFTGPGQNNVKVNGFYDGDGVYKVRFMPSYEGEYFFRIEASFLPEAQEGAFTATPAGEGNHGPVRVAYTYHFAYEDGTMYYPVGTTCYVWELQSAELQKKTLEELAKGYFNKIRFCVFPKHYIYNFHEPVSYPYEGTPVDTAGMNKKNFSEYGAEDKGNHWDFHRFNPAHFRHIEECILALQKLGIEADLIVMHPYDRWGFSHMKPDQDDLYWNYVVNRFSAYRNVWWSFANEWDLLRDKTVADWERYADIVVKNDHVQHLRSIHNCHTLYDYSKPWITHCCIQRQPDTMPVEMTNVWRDRYRKPIVIDELCYEGNINNAWGCISAQEMTRRFWETTMRGGYAGHGETYVHPEDILWWSHGGQLHGESPARLRFLKGILEELPEGGLQFAGRRLAVNQRRMADNRWVHLEYLGKSTPSFLEYAFEEGRYHVEVIDTWNMTIEDKGVFGPEFTIDLPGCEFMAVRITKL